jgi:hypothetical protein
MKSSQQWKQLKLYADILSTSVCRDTGSEEFITSYLSESPTEQILLK